MLLLILSLLFIVAQMPEYLLFEIPCAVFLCWLADCFNKQKNKQADAYDAYLEQVKEYESAVEQREQAVETVKACLQKAYEETVSKASNAYRTFVLRRDETLQAESNKINALICECEQTLRKLYSQDIVHSKYRNLTACCMFLEYLEAGRCEALTGANGAYNLYESELRQNLIIFKLDEVAERLDDLKSTMYRCCQAIESVRKQLNVVHSDMVQLNDTAQKQLKLSALTTVYAAATAANTSAIKYLTLIQ